MTSVLEVEYGDMSKWALGIRAAIQANRTLTIRDAWWSLYSHAGCYTPQTTRAASGNSGN